MSLPVKLSQDQVQQQDVVYPDFDYNKHIKVYINGFLVKTAYAIQEDATAQLKRIKLSEKANNDQITVSVQFEVNGMRKEIEITGLLTQLMITAWGKIE